MFAKRPVGLVTESCFEMVEVPVPELGEGEALLQVRYLGIDPTIRGWLDERGNYMAGVAIGEPVRSNGVGVCVETNNPQEYPLGRRSCTSPAGSSTASCRPTRSRRSRWCPTTSTPMLTFGVLGHIGFTAYLGVLEVAKPQPGETFCVSAAASSVGSIAGQIAKMQGARRHRYRGLAREVCVGGRRPRLRRVHRLQDAKMSPLG